MVLSRYCLISPHFWAHYPGQYYIQWSPDLTNRSGPSQLFVIPGYSLNPNFLWSKKIFLVQNRFVKSGWFVKTEFVKSGEHCSVKYYNKIEPINNWTYLFNHAHYTIFPKIMSLHPASTAIGCNDIIRLKRIDLLKTSCEIGERKKWKKVKSRMNDFAVFFSLSVFVHKCDFV